MIYQNKNIVDCMNRNRWNFNDVCENLFNIDRQINEFIKNVERCQKKLIMCNYDNINFRIFNVYENFNYDCIYLNSWLFYWYSNNTIE